MRLVARRMRPYPAACLITAVLCGLVTGCADTEVEIRTHCEGPDMIYEAWDREPNDEDDVQLDFDQIHVAPNDPRCAGAGTPPATLNPLPTSSTLVPAPRPSTS